MPSKEEVSHSPNGRELHIILTDIQLHVLEPRKPKTLAENVQKTIRSGKLDRTYTTSALQLVNNDGLKVTLPSMVGLAEVIKDAQQRGVKVRIFTPTDGMSLSLGKDAIEKLKAMDRAERLR